MKWKLMAVCAALAVATVPFAGAATAAGRAETKVTIRTENGDFWGYVNSTRPRRCAEGRKVVLFKQKGAVQDPKVDKRIASDTAMLVVDRAEWNTGNTGIYGRFYARAGRTEFCKGDTSKTIRSVRP